MDSTALTPGQRPYASAGEWAKRREIPPSPGESGAAKDSTALTPGQRPYASAGEWAKR